VEFGQLRGAGRLGQPFAQEAARLVEQPLPLVLRIPPMINSRSVSSSHANKRSSNVQTSRNFSWQPLSKSAAADDKGNMTKSPH